MSVCSVRKMAVVWPWLLPLGLCLTTTPSVQAEHLPIKTYTTADGLLSNRISRIVRDSRGYLWFCTEEGLSRFDGYSFTSYTVDQGLPDNEVNDLLESRDGAYWIATGKGLCRFDPRGMPLAGRQAPLGFQSSGNAQPMFTLYRPGDERRASAIRTLYQDRAGTIWCGTWQGLYRVEQAGDQVGFLYVDIGMPKNEPRTHIVRDILEDGRGILWVTTDSGLYRRFGDGHAERFTTRNGLSSNIIMGIVEDREGRLWIGDRYGGLCRIVRDADINGPIVARRYSLREGLTCAQVAALYQSHDGRLWIGTDCGLWEMTPGTDDTGRKIKSFLGAEILADPRVWSLAEDTDGTLWIGSAGGAVKVSRGGLSTYTEADGLGARDVVSIIESQSGEVCVETRSPPRAFVSRFDGRRFSSIELKLPKQGASYDWLILPQNKNGEWWLVTTAGLWRFPVTGSVQELTRPPREALYTIKGGPLASRGFSAYEDSHGDIWISVGGEKRLLRWERRTAILHAYSEAEGMPPIGEFADSYCEDGAGNLWVALNEAGVARYSNGRFRLFTSADGIPIGVSRRLFVDSKGRLWIASSKGGLGRIDDPTADQPQILTYTTAEGIASNDVWCIAEDRLERFYIGTTRGLDQLDLATGRVKHLTVADGLANNHIRMSFRDRDGALWFGSETGLSRLIPEPDRYSGPPPIFIKRLQIAGSDYRLSELGETALRGLQLGPGQNRVQVDFVGVAFGAGENLRYQYVLEGAETDWNPLTDQRTVNYASLAPGAYRFLVRAVNAEGEFSSTPASVEFRILAPIWRRWWFLALAAVLTGLAMYSIYRYRLVQKLALEGVRTRIAADLHDDIGSNLTRIAILSEVAHSRLKEANPNIDNPLSAIASISRESVASMSDIVWAINPKKDSLLDLVHRMRRFASEIFATRKIEFQFRAPETEDGLKLGVDVRRNVFLIFKEAVNNAAKHSEGRNVEIELRLEGSWLVLTVSDDGKGFDTEQPFDGQGLLSIKRRAKSLGGELILTSSGDQGTDVTLRVPRRVR